jgi:phosphoglycerate dehydrogenase-like enzyme
MDVIGLRRSGAPLACARRVYGPHELHAFLSHCDFVVLATPLTDETRGMIGAAEFAAMKSSARIVNVARGAVVHEPAMVDALARQAIAGACLDVFAVEPLPQHSPLWTLPNVIVTPHIAGMRADYAERFTDLLIDNFQRYARQQPLRNDFDFDRGY